MKSNLRAMKFSKRGQLEKGFVEILVAVIIIAIVFTGAGYLIYKYFQLSKVQNDEEARGLLKVLEAKMSALKEGEKSDFLMRGPCEGNKPTEECNWYLTGWGKEDSNRPQKCFFKSCVCVCRSGVDSISLKDKDVALRDACQGKEEHLGFCTFVDVKNVKVSSVQKQPQKQGEGSVIEGVVNAPMIEQPAIDKSFIPFKSNLIELLMKRTPDGLEITLA